MDIKKRIFENRKHNYGVTFSSIYFSQKMGKGEVLIEFANFKFGSKKTVTAVEKSCSGTGGDIGPRVSDLLSDSINNLRIGNDADFGFFSSQTCEIGLMYDATLDFARIEELVETLTFKSD